VSFHWRRKRKEKNTKIHRIVNVSNTMSSFLQYEENNSLSMQKRKQSKEEGKEKKKKEVGENHERIK
jgi:hypothetical protein